MKWEAVKLGDVIDFFDARRVPLNSGQRAQRQGPYPYYGASGIVDYIDDFIFEGRYLLVAEDGENLNSRKLPVAFFAKGRFWVNNHAHIIRGKADKADDEFLKHWFAQTNISGYITGAAQPKLSQMNMKQIEIDLPPLPTQQRIAAILSAYDDLIENNTRRIAILEEMARRLYDEWFVCFRFPGHETAKFDGDLPTGWSEVTLGEVADVAWGDTKTTKKSYVDSGCVAYSAAGPDGFLPHFDYERTGIVLSAIGANCGITWFARGKWSCIKNTIRFFSRDQSISDEYLFFTTGLSDYWPKRGAAQPFISQGDAKQCKVVVPSESLHERFLAIARPALKQADNLRHMNANLRAQSDLLLPKLVSGEIDVSRAEAMLEAAE
ncbi:Type I restriction modification DNA specificity domain protein [Pseudooceanicola marinus]|uniref:Type I restriction modification DNA specificity domain protein n=1 Tax=Pseudooceanicola marinus TaxID=396013 RepID=A0A1X7ABU6_9RHOB|nr:restriction endonuclease subunit S [Pseudooceanicola marinus]PJE33762.1 restriction endonuclease subunit S [Pseudooceanicola marinus]SLN75109.1 Type I restriction modification DNA specificity domain protein [Pseudooceanicola marinus]